MDTQGLTKVVVAKNSRSGIPNPTTSCQAKSLIFEFILDESWNEILKFDDHSTHKLYGIRDILNYNKVQFGLRMFKKNSGARGWRPVLYKHVASKIISDQPFKNIELLCKLRYRVAMSRLGDNTWLMELGGPNIDMPVRLVTNEVIDIKKIFFVNPYMTGVYVEIKDSPAPADIITWTNIIQLV